MRVSKRTTPTERMKALVERMVPGSEPGTVNIYPARGWYRTFRADCMGFTGDVKVSGVARSIGSWDTLTRCLRNGCKVIDNGRDNRAYCQFEFVANEGGPVPSKAEDLDRWLRRGRPTSTAEPDRGRGGG